MKFEKISPLVRSQLTETAGSHSGEELKFLRAREVARECEEAGPIRGQYPGHVISQDQSEARECEEASLLEITSEQELSDNDQGLEIFPVTSDTIKANGDSDRGDAVWTNQRPVLGSRDQSGPIRGEVWDLQAQLAEMRLEIARMVEEAEERLDSSDITEDSEEEEDEDQEEEVYEKEEEQHYGEVQQH